MQDEVDTLKTKIFTLKEDKASTQEMAEKTQKLAERVKASLGKTGMAAIKVKLFDKEVYKEKKLSRLQIV